MRIAALDMRVELVSPHRGARGDRRPHRDPRPRQGDGAAGRLDAAHAASSRPRCSAAASTRSRAAAHRRAAQPDALVAVATSAVREAQNGGEFVRAARDEAGHRHPRHPRRRGGAPHLSGRARRARPRRAAGSRSSTRRGLDGAHPGRRARVLLHGVAQAGRHAPARRVAVLRTRRARASSAQLGERVRSAARAGHRARAGHGLRLRGVHLGDGLRAGRRRRATRNGSGNGDRGARFRTLCDARAAAWARCSLASAAKLPGLDARRADTIVPGRRRVCATVLELAGADEAALCETALREGIIADYVATNRPGILLVDEFPDLRRRTVMELARRCQYPRGPLARTWRGWRSRSSTRRGGCTGSPTATPSCWSTRRCCTTSASTSRRTAITGTRST